MKVKSQGRILVGQASICTVFTTYSCANVIYKKKLLEIGQKSSVIYSKTQESRPILCTLTEDEDQSTACIGLPPPCYWHTHILCSVDSDDYPLPKPKITLQSIAQRWLIKLSNEENLEPKDNVASGQDDGVSVVPPSQCDVELVQEEKHEETTTSNPNNSRESCKSEEGDIVLHSTPATGSSAPPMLSQDANVSYTKPGDSTYTKADESCTDLDNPTLPSTTQIQIPSTKNVVNEVGD